jgi:hypothetical protein
VDQIADHVQEQAAKSAAGEWQAEAGEAVKQVRTFLDKSMKERPMATLAGAITLAFCIGAMLRKN